MSKVSFGNATAVWAALLRDKRDPEAVTPRRDLLDAESIGLAPSCREFFMKLIDFLNSKTWTKNRCSSLFVPVLSGAPTITKLQKGQINYLPCLCVRRICLLLRIDYWIWRIFQYFNSVSFFFFFCFWQAHLSGPICIPVWLGHPLRSWCFEHAPRCAYSSVVVHLRNLVN